MLDTLQKKGLVIASHNVGKIAEFSAFFASFGVEVIGANSFNLTAPDETGKTFVENAKIKAEAVFDAVQRPVLADDSGLCVDALSGRPGVFSARYGGYTALLKEMTPFLQKEQRKAQFYCVLHLYNGKDFSFIFEGVSEGVITFSPAGSFGFGYDPVFIPKGENKTYAQCTAEEKTKTSHRNMALNLLKEALL